MSQLLHFYRGEAPDTEGRYLQEMWAWNDEELEIAHDYIQWMFPLSEPSRFNPDAPVLTSGDIAEFRGDERVQANLSKSFLRILTFLGLSLTDKGIVSEGPNFAHRVPEVWSIPNHNWLRITRILGSLSLLGQRSCAAALYDQLYRIYSRRHFPITAETFHHWEDAVSHAGSDTT